jgi:hypothetical protein
VLTVNRFGATGEQPRGPGLAVTAANGKIDVFPLAIIAAHHLLEAEARNILVYGSASTDPVVSTTRSMARDLFYQRGLLRSRTYAATGFLYREMGNVS